MIAIQNYVPLMIALAISIVVMIYGFESKNKKATLIYFGFFTINTILLFTHILGHWLKADLVVETVMKLSYMVYLLMPAFFTNALAEVISTQCFFNKTRVNIISSILALVGGIIIFFRPETFVGAGGMFSLDWHYSVAFAIYFVSFGSFLSYRYLSNLRNKKKDHPVGERVAIILTIALFLGIGLIELLKNAGASIHYLNEAFILALILALFYNGFLNKLIEVERSAYIFIAIIIALLILSGSIYANYGAEKEVSSTIRVEFEKRVESVQTLVQEAVENRLHNIEEYSRNMEKSLVFMKYFDKTQNPLEMESFFIVRLNEFEENEQAHICFIDDAGNTMCSNGFERGSLGVINENYFRMANAFDNLVITAPISRNGVEKVFALRRAEYLGKTRGVFVVDLDQQYMESLFERHEIRTDITISDLENGDKKPIFSTKGSSEANNGETVKFEGLIVAGGRTWVIETEESLSETTNLINNAIRKIRNSSMFGMIFIFASAMAAIFLFVKYSRNLATEVEKKTSEIAQSKREIETMNLELKKSNKNLAGKIGELENTKKAMLNLLEDIRQSNEQLKSIDVLKTDFMNVSSHELKTPLISIMGYAELLLGESNLTEEEKNSLEIIHRNSQRLKSLVTDILTISKLESDSMPFNPTKFEFGTLVDEAITQLESVAKQKNIRIEKKIDKEEVVGDKDLLSHLFPNLMSNAIKFTPEGGIVKIEVRGEKEKIIGSVSDTGIGIPQKLINNLFQKFYQVDSGRDRKFGGTGLGLSICKGIVEKHGGRIWVESAEGKGTKFTFEIPKKQRTKEE